MSVIACPRIKAESVPIVTEPLTSIIEQISRHYNVVVTYNSRLLAGIDVEFNFNESEDFETAINRALVSTQLQCKKLTDKYYVVLSRDKKSSNTIKKLRKKFKEIEELERSENFDLLLINRAEEGTVHYSNISPDVVTKRTITGRVIDEEGFPVIGASIIIKGSGQGTVTDVNGNYELTIPEDNTILTISYIGYNTQEIVVVKGMLKVAETVLRTDGELLEEVIVKEKSLSRELSENPMQIVSIDVKSLKNETAEVVSVLDRSTGIRVRQSGGLGSNTTIQLNGLTGGAVRTYLDGIPLEHFGGGVQLNNLPVNAIEKINVYKGVMPVDVATDALGGGINVITTEPHYDYLDASYQIGSFNTHKFTLNAGKTLNKDVIFSVGGFYNYSDNSYKIRAFQRTANFKEEEVTVNRFHNAHESFSLSGSINIKNNLWADKFSLSVNYSDRSDEIQHGLRIGNIAVGEANTSATSIVGTAKYEKTIGKKLTVAYRGNYLQAKNVVRDSTDNIYNWEGEVVAFNQSGSEVAGRPFNREGISRSIVQRVNARYSLTDKHNLVASSYLSNRNIKGKDPYAPLVGGRDPNTFPSDLMRSISGLSSESQWFNNRLESILFAKYYHYRQEVANIFSETGDRVFVFEQKGSNLGYGLALKYSFNENFFARTSFESAIRIPSRLEIFGDFIAITPNLALEPEKSQNINFGAYYKFDIDSYRYFSIDINTFLRDQSNLIRLEPGGYPTAPGQFVNELEADAKGIELSFAFTPIKDLTASFNVTYQQVLRAGEENELGTKGIGRPLPNIPSFFYNTSLRYQIKSPFSISDKISANLYFSHVDEFDLIFQTTANQDNLIPVQNQLDLGIGYQWEKSGLSTSFNINNVLNSEVFDNFRVPKPGIQYALKIRYLFANYKI